MRWMESKKGRVGRTVTTTICSCTKVGEDRSTVSFTYSLFGSYNEQRATREIRRREHDSTINVLECETASEYRSMSLEDFVKYSVLTD